MPRYHCYAPEHLIPGEMIEAESGFSARRAFAAEHDLSGPTDVISRREDMIDAKWRKLVNPIGWDVVEV